ncbi:DUF2189 domain-containing protein [Acuticoccus kandeliae]|uniref:DUF2189 domain-containing protein n=1 Tax=Acuticoccus kandeliae TaxID=2073160 RepID=UPI000D3E0D51|nr:DUF2189 domain-containing protein [Acuticoccus kandeliae]
MARSATHHFDDEVDLHLGLDLIGESLKDGWRDYVARPSTGLFLIIVYPVIGLVLLRFAFHQDLLPLLFPMTTGFAIIGPLTAVGLYALSAQRERGDGSELDGVRAMGALTGGPLGPTFRIGLVLAAIYAAWLGSALLIYRATLGEDAPTDIATLFDWVLNRPEGWALLVIGCAVGFIYALLALIVGSMSLPAVFDRRIGARAAIGLSARTFFHHPGTMLAWGATVAVILAIACIPAFLGLLVALPVLGHASWHLYRRLVP